MISRILVPLKVGGEVQLGAGASGEFRFVLLKEDSGSIYMAVCVWAPARRDLWRVRLLLNCLWSSQYGLSINSMVWTISTG